MKSKTWIAEVILAVAVAGLGAGAVLVKSTATDSPAEIELDATRHIARSVPDDSASDRVGTGFYDETAVEQEIRWTERALAVSRRISEPTAEAKRETGLRASGNALAAAAADSAPVALACEGEGLACRSSADCCPGLGCAGGVAGYGTSGRCQAPR